MRRPPLILAALVLGLGACERPAPASSAAEPDTRQVPQQASAQSERPEPVISPVATDEPAGTPAPAESPAPAPPEPPPAAAANRLPLARILQIAGDHVPGEVIDVEIDEDDDDGSETYELEILTPEDRVIEMTLDARTGEVLEMEED